MTFVLDASALLAFLQGESGAAEVERALTAGGAVVGAANWSETARVVTRAGRDWDLARALLLGFGVEVEPVTETDAEVAAVGYPGDAGLALGDRLCLALAERLDAPVLTADRAWEGHARVELFR